ncbi:tetraspanin [Elysia marginata]|uniref:Tetraspanin n=1 Tax=Elysia marginata TaxID=1093978 RepID=A0AAV4FKT1_9GAST|nr:tetraspanin [Elysia marginata]
MLSLFIYIYISQPLTPSHIHGNAPRESKQGDCSIDGIRILNRLCGLAVCDVLCLNLCSVSPPQYLVSVVLAMCLTIGSVVYGSIYRDELERTLLKSDFLQDTIQKKYFDDKQNQVTRAVDIMQSELECCGGEGPLDYREAVWRLQKDKLVELPASCCKRYLQHKDRTKTCYLFKSDTDKEKSEDVWQNGCKKNLQEFLDNYIIVIISIAAVYFLLQLICMIVTSILIHVLNSLYVPQPDDIVYDMAHNQEKSPYPSRGDYRDYYH